VANLSLGVTSHQFLKSSSKKSENNFKTGSAFSAVQSISYIFDVDVVAKPNPSQPINSNARNRTSPGYCLVAVQDRLPGFPLIGYEEEAGV